MGVWRSRSDTLRVVAYTDSVGRGGAEISLGNLLAALPPEIKVVVVAIDRAVIGWIAARRPGTPALVLPDGARGLAAHIRTFRHLRPDVVHINKSVPWACAVAHIAALLTPGVRVVMVDQLPLRTTEAFLLWRTRALALRADALVAVGQASATRLEDFYALGRGSVCSILNCVPPVSEVAPEPAEPVPSSVLRIVAVGRLDAMKAHDVLLRALACVTGARLTILGDGGERAALQRLAVELRIGDRVDLRGWVEDPRAHLPRYDVFVLPSRSEGFPLTMVEAMLAGLPIVATPVGSIAEAITDGETGLLVPVNDVEALATALVRLRDDYELRVRLGTRGQAVAEARFTVEHMVDAYAALWRAVIARPRAPRVRVPTPKA